MRPREILGVLLLLTSFAALGGGCNRAAPKLAPTKPTEVFFTRPTTGSVREYEDFTGRTEALRSVDLRARVSGYLDLVNFKDGVDVKEGDLLFRIDQRPFTVMVDQTQASLAQAEARLKRINRDYSRVSTLGQSNAVSRQEIDQVTGDKTEAEAAVTLAKAKLKFDQTNLAFTEIHAPFDGRISRRLIDEGNLVVTDQTILTTLVKMDPIYAYFDIDERTLLRIRRLIREGKVDSARTSEVKVQIGLADEEGFSREGTIGFIDNHVDPNTGTLRVRATVPNENLLLSPGLFLRIRLPIGKPYEATLIPEEALQSDQGQKYVYLLNDRDEVVYRRVKIGILEGGKREIKEGVAAGDRVIVSGLQRVKPGAKVDPKPFAPDGDAKAASPGEKAAQGDAPGKTETSKNGS